MDSSPDSAEALARNFRAELENSSVPQQHVAGLKAWLDERIGFWGGRTWRVGLIGITSAGKSTLLNALMGEALLPARVRPSSNVLILVRKSRREGSPTAQVRYSDGRSQQLRHRLAAELAALGDESCNPGNRLGVTEIAVSHPDFALSGDIVGVDTPGLNAFGLQEHEALTMKTFLPTVDLVVFVTTAKSNADSVISGYLQEIASAGKPLVLVQNMIDTVQPKLGIGGVEVRSRGEVAEELRARTNRLLASALGPGRAIVHQVAAKLALQGRPEASGIPQLAHAIEGQVERMRPTFQRGRLIQLVREVERQTPAETIEEDRESWEAERTALEDASERMEQLGRAMRSSGVPVKVTREAAKLRRRALGLRSEHVDAAHGVREAAHEWFRKAAAHLAQRTEDRQRRVGELAEVLGLRMEDYVVSLAPALAWPGVTVPVSVKQWSEKRALKGAFNWIRRKLGMGGEETIQYTTRRLDTERFRRDLEQVLGDGVAWYEVEHRRTRQIFVGYLGRLREELRRRLDQVELREANAVNLEQRARLRVLLLRWQETLRGKIERIRCDSGPVSGEGIRVKSDAGRVVELSPPALELVRLADCVAHVRFSELRQMAFERCPEASQSVYCIGWDADELAALLSRFFPWVQPSADAPVWHHHGDSDGPLVTVVDESRCDHTYDEHDRATAFVMLAIEQPGSTESTLRDESHLWKSRFGAVCLVVQSIRVFRGTDGWDVDGLVEAALEAKKLCEALGVRPEAWLVNDDDAGWSLLFDALMAAGCTVRSLEDERRLIQSITPAMAPHVAGAFVRRWRQSTVTAEGA